MIYLLEGEETERLFFRRLLESDFETWMRFCENDISTKYFTSMNHISQPKEKCKFWFDKIFKRYTENLGGMNVLIDKKSKEFVGQCGLLVQEIEGKKELEIAYSLMPSFQNKGYAIEAAIKCKEFAFEKNYSESLISLIHIENKKSIHVALKNKMIFEKEILYNTFPASIYRVNKLVSL